MSKEVWGSRGSLQRASQRNEHGARARLSGVAVGRGFNACDQMFEGIRNVALTVRVQRDLVEERTSTIRHIGTWNCGIEHPDRFTLGDRVGVRGHVNEK